MQTLTVDTIIFRGGRRPIFPQNPKVTKRLDRQNLTRTPPDFQASTNRPPSPHAYKGTCKMVLVRQIKSSTLSNRYLDTRGKDASPGPPLPRDWPFDAGIHANRRHEEVLHAVHQSLHNVWNEFARESAYADVHLRLQVSTSSLACLHGNDFLLSLV
jgi:hypothetical protein